MVFCTKTNKPLLTTPSAPGQPCITERKKVVSGFDKGGKKVGKVLAWASPCWLDSC